MSGLLVDDLTPPKTRPHPLSRESLRRDFKLFQLGLLDPKAFVESYRRHDHFVEWSFTTLVGDDTARQHVSKLSNDPGDYTDPVYVNGELRDAAFGLRRRMFTAIRRHQNLRTTQGRDNWQRLGMFGDISANQTAYTGVAGAATATSATSLTNSGAAFPTSAGLNGSLQGHVVYARQVYGVAMSNTGTAITVDQWYNPASATGAAGSTPSSSTDYVVGPGGTVLWIGLSTNSAAAAAGDVLRTSDGLFGDGTTGAAATEPTTNGLARAFVQPTFPQAARIQLQKTWTYLGSSTVVLAKGVLCNSLAAAGSLMFLETLMSATGTVNANGDNLQGTWTIDL